MVVGPRGLRRQGVEKARDWSRGLRLGFVWAPRKCVKELEKKNG